MAKYGSTAVRSVGLLHAGCESAHKAWQSIAEKVSPDSLDACEKVCPAKLSSVFAQLA